MAVAERGSLVLTGFNGQTRTIDLYASDVANALFTMNPAGAAGAASDTFYIVQNDALITDYIQITGFGAVTIANVLLNGVPIGQPLSMVIANPALAGIRPQLRIPVRRGDKLQLVQVA